MDTTPDFPESWEHHEIRTNGIRLHVVQAGPKNGPLVILLHGFPEYWRGWRHQIGALAEAGFRVWVPDQRGYNTSEKPPRVRDYDIEKLAADIIGLIDAAGYETAAIAGHDWGAAVAWWVAGHYPDRVSRLVTVNVPHASVFLRHIKRNPRQWLRSSYILLFQVPLLPERVAAWRNWRLPIEAMRHSSRPGAFTPSDWTAYRQAWVQPGAYGAMLNWYRAALRRRPGSLAVRRISVPTLVLWGALDQFLDRRMAAQSLEYCDNRQLALFEDATHWILHEQPARVNALLSEFLRQPQT